VGAGSPVAGECQGCLPGGLVPAWGSLNGGNVEVVNPRSVGEGPWGGLPVLGPGFLWGSLGPACSTTVQEGCLGPGNWLVLF